MRRRSERFVEELLGLFKVDDVDGISRKDINHQHVALMCNFLPRETDEILVKWFLAADVNRGAIHVPPDEHLFIASGFGKMCSSARKIISRIIASQGREVEILPSGIIVWPHKDVLKKCSCKCVCE